MNGVKRPWPRTQRKYENRVERCRSRVSTSAVEQRGHGRRERIERIGSRSASWIAFSSASVAPGVSCRLSKPSNHSARHATHTSIVVAPAGLRSRRWTAMA